MRRPPATIVVPVWNAWEVTRRCLETLRPTLGARDQVVVVDNGSEDGTRVGLRKFGWVQVVTNSTNLGFARACNQGAAAARHDLIVFLNNDTLLPAHWLDALLDPFSDTGVVAAGPRSNFVSGPQLVPGCDYANGSVADMRRFARQWMAEHRQETSDVERLVGFCLAVRSDAFCAVGGFDEGYQIGGYEDDDLCLKLRRAGGRLLIVHGSFVHHQGHVTFEANGVSWQDQETINYRRFVSQHSGEDDGAPLVSACLITRDEEENLGDCLSSLAGLADEIVVHDTGSTDGTVELAAAAGAKVSRGEWTDDFAAARNASLAGCRGRWVLWIDADERVQGDVAAVRQLLEHTDPRVEGFQVLIENLLGTGLATRSVHPACRLFRRSVGRWAGRFHEQVVGPDGRALQIVALSDMRLLHTGYTDAAMQDRDKVERNLRLARAEVERATDDPFGQEPAMARANLGRTLFIAGRYEESLEECRQALAEAGQPFIKRMALRMTVDSLLALGWADAALDACAELRRHCEARVLPDLMEARARLLLGQPERALRLLEGIGDRQLDDDSFEYAGEVTAPLRARALAELGRPAEAAVALLAALAAGACDVHVGTIAELLMLAGRSPDEIGPRVPPQFQRPVLAQVLQLAPEVADAILEGWWASGPAEPNAVLAAAANIAHRLPLVRALQWSHRLRQRGLVSACPLTAIASDPAHPVMIRVRAAAAAYGTFGQDSDSQALAALLAGLNPEDRAAARLEVAALCPQLAETA